MIIECPQCGFSGRVPARATLAPHQARCPKCRFRFDIVDSQPAPSSPAGRSDLRHDQTRPRLDPSDSSYELDPITEGFDGEWDGWGEEEEGAGDPFPAHHGSTEPPRSAVSSGTGWASRALRPSVWRIRLFQAWAIFFLIWAGLIAFRAVRATLELDEPRILSHDLLRQVVAIVVLVSAAALLCLSVDLSRRLARLTYGPSPSPAPSPAPSPSSNGHGEIPFRRRATDLARRSGDLHE